MRQAQREFVIETHGQGLYEFTGEVERWVRQEGIAQGLLSLFCRHSSASLLIQENADPDVVHDLAVFFSRVAPEDARLYRHSVEGPDDMPAHIRAALTQTSLTIPVAQGRAALGAWQGIYLFEHRDRPHRRHVLGHVLGE
ncbi:MAG: secondary thiamine-phosphate synthase enzyme YjbQ [Bryobacteraceae bacterium]|jgi:secondary thiamine-phosphate synthase enzyme